MSAYPAQQILPLPAGIRFIPAVTFVAAFENMSAPPALLVIAGGFETTLAQAAWTVTAYALAYGLAQLVWGTLAVRFGKRTILRAGLGAAAACDLVSMFAPSLEALIASRAMAGACVGAVIPCVIGLVGDVVPLERRQRSMTDLITGHAAGTALGTLCGGAAADLISWHAVFGVGAALTAAGAVLGSRLPEGQRDRTARLLAVARRLPTVLCRRWSLMVILFGMLEGAVLFALVHFLSPALIVAGMPAKWAGAIVAAYGVSVLIWSRIANRLAIRLRILAMMTIGFGLMVAGHIAAAIDIGPFGILSAAILLSGATAFVHSSLQVWSTEAVPELRGLVVPVFACFLFSGNAAVIQIIAQAKTVADFAAVYAWGAVAAVVSGLVMLIARRAYEAETQNSRLERGSGHIVGRKN